MIVHPSLFAAVQIMGSFFTTALLTIFASDDSSLESPAEGRRKVQLALKGQELDSDPPSSFALTSDQTKAGDIPTETSPESGHANLARDSGVEAVDDGSLPPQSSLQNAAEFVIKAVFFPINLLFSFNKLPFRLLHWATAAAKERLLGALFDKVVLFERIIVQVAGKLAWGFLCTLYVCFFLFWILIASFLEGHLIMRSMVEEPIQIIEELSFDYAKFTPEALVPIPSCDGYLVSGDKPVAASYDVLRLVPPNQKLQATISLTLPESYYNRNVGVFQVRMELLTLDGTVTSTPSQPCVLRFKSPHIR